MSIIKKTNTLDLFSPEVLVSKYNINPEFAFNPNLVQEIKDLIEGMQVQVDSSEPNCIEMSSVEKSDGISQVKIFLNCNQISIIRYDTSKNTDRQRSSQIIREKCIALSNQNNLVTTQVHLIFQDCQEKPLTRRIVVKRSVCDSNGVIDSLRKLEIEYTGHNSDKTNLNYEELLTIARAHFSLASANLSSAIDVVAPGSLELTRHGEFSEYAYLQKLKTEDDFETIVVPLFSHTLGTGMLIGMNSDLIANNPDSLLEGLPRLTLEEIEYFIEDEIAPNNTKSAMKERLTRGKQL